MKKILMVVLMSAMLLSASVTTYAAEAASTSMLPVDSEVTSEAKVSFKDNLNGNTRSTSIPTSFFDLGMRDYEATLEYVNLNWLYTNYYFAPNPDGEIHVEYTIYSNTGRPTPMAIGLYNMDNEEMEVEWVTESATRDGITGSMYFYDLDPAYRYAIAFTAVWDGFSHDAVSGTATISH